MGKTEIVLYFNGNLYLYFSTEILFVIRVSILFLHPRLVHSQWFHAVGNNHDNKIQKRLLEKRMGMNHRKINLQIPLPFIEFSHIHPLMMNSCIHTHRIHSKSKFRIWWQCRYDFQKLQCELFQTTLIYFN